MKKDLEGKTAIITGAGRLRGIGRATAVALSKLGANIVVTGTGKNPETFPQDEKDIGWNDIESTAEQVRNEGSLAKTIITDITKESDVKFLIESTLEKFGSLDILVNNAAAPYGEDRVPIVEIENEIFKKVINTKLYGSFLCSKFAAIAMISQKKGGRIINLSSSAGKEGSARMGAYNAANFAIEGFTQALAKELAMEKITVNSVCPGMTETSRLDPLGRGALWKSKAENIPMGRVGTDQEVADLIAFLSTDKARFITGQSININGGSVTSR